MARGQSKQVVDEVAAEPTLVTAGEVCERFGITASFFSSQVCAEAIRPVGSRFAGALQFTEDAVQRWYAEKESLINSEANRYQVVLQERARMAALKRRF